MSILPDHYVGPAAGIATSILWTATSLFFTASGRRIGSAILNPYRIFVAVFLLGGTHLAMTGLIWPEMVGYQLLLLAASGLIGLSIGDQALFTAFVDIGPRISMLIMTTSPLFAVAFGFFFLDEHLTWFSGLCILITVAGVAWVILERPPVKRTKDQQRHFSRGVALAFVGAICQAGGLLLSKQGIGHGWRPEDQHLSAQAASYVRMVFAAIGVVPVSAIHIALARREHSRRAFTPPAKQRDLVAAGYWYGFLGAVVGPFLGMWMSLVAADKAPLGIAQTLCSLAPILILPIVALTGQDRVSLRAAAGAAIAVAGSALLFFDASVPANASSDAAQAPSPPAQVEITPLEPASPAIHPTP